MGRKFRCLFLLLIGVGQACVIDNEVSAQCTPSNPTAAFTLSTDSSVCSGTAIEFYSSSSAYKGILSWDFGDNTSNSDTSSQDTATYTFTNSSVSSQAFHVLLLVVDSCGNLDSVSQEIYVAQEFTVDFSVSSGQYACDSALVTFPNSSTGAGLSYDWSFGDPSSGSSNSSTSASPSHRFDIGSALDTFLIKLVVSDTCGHSDSVIKQLIVSPLPQAIFSFTDSLCAGEVAFVNTSSGSGLNYAWNFGDPSSGSNNTSTVSAPNHTFDTIGSGYISYAVSLTATNAYGCSNTKQQNVFIRRGPDPTVDDFTSSLAFAQCSSSPSFFLTIDNSSTTSNNVYYLINWGDSSGIDSLTSFSQDTHTYIGFGLRKLSVWVVDNVGCSKSDTIGVFNGSNPSGGLASPGSTVNLCSPIQLGFPLTSVSNNPSGTTYTLSVNDGSASVTYTHPPPDTVYHLFNQGSCGSTVNASTTYDNAFGVTLTITNPCGFTASSILPITISGKPKAGIQSSHDTACINRDLVFVDDVSSGANYVTQVGTNFTCDTVPLRRWRIDRPSSDYTLVQGYLGGATFNTNATPGVNGNGSAALRFRFTDTGKFVISLLSGYPATNTVKCGYDSTDYIIYVVDTVVAGFDFALNPANGCVNNSFSPSNLSTGPIESYRWTVTPSAGFSFQSGNQYSQTPTLRFTQAGEYTVNLKVFGYCNDDDTTTTIIIRARPLVQLPADRSYCGAQSINFSGVNHAPTIDTNFSSLTSFRWRVFGGSVAFEGGTDSTSQLPQMRFQDTGLHLVLFTATNACGESIADTQRIHISPIPSLGSLSTIEVCPGDSIFPPAFISNPTGASYTWTNSNTAIGLGSSGNGQIAAFKAANNTSGVTQEGVVLIVSSIYGCTNTGDTLRIRVKPKPVLSPISDIEVCPGDSVLISSFTASPSGASFSWTNTNDSIGLGTSGHGSIPGFVAPSNTGTSAIIGAIHFMGSLNSCPSETDSFDVIIRTRPKMVGLVDTVICPDITFSYPSFNSEPSGASFSWYNSNSTLGLADSGTGNITFTSFHNTTGSNQNASIVVYPNYNVCLGTPDTFVLSVKPAPELLATNDSLVCPGDSVFIPAFLASPSGGSFSWTNSNPALGFAASGTGNIAFKAAPNTSGSNRVAQVIVLSILNGCQGYADTFSLSIKPSPIPQAISDILVCPNDSVLPNNFSASPAGASFEWTNGNTSIGLSASGTGKVPDFKASANTTGSTLTGWIIYTPTLSSCVGPSDSFFIGVKPTPSMVAQTDIEVCTWEQVQVNGFTSSPAGSSFAWTNSNTANGLANSGNGSISNFLAPENTTGSLISGSVRVVPTLNSCAGIADTFDISVRPQPLADAGLDDTLCSGQSAQIGQIAQSGESYSWTSIPAGYSDTASSVIVSPNSSIRYILSTYDSITGCLQRDTVGILINPVLGANSISSEQIICAGQTPNSLNGGSPTGGNSSYSYQWQLSTDSSSWSDIAGAISSNYSSGALQLNTHFRRVVVSGPCSDTSSILRVIVLPELDNNYIGVSDSICAFFAPDSLRGSLPTGGNGGFSYSWQMSSDSTQSPSTITGANGQSYYPGALSSTTYFRRVVSSGACVVPGNWVEIRVKPKPSAAFTVNNACFDFVHNFTNQSTVATGSLSAYSWDFGDTTGSSLENRTHTYAYAGVKTAKLIITSDFGCQDSVTKTLFVNPKPVAAFDSSNACLQLANVFTNQSTVSSGSLISYSWTFGDGSGASSVSPSHIYGDTGTYAIRLIVSSDSGCTDSVFKTVEVYPKPIAGMITEDVCFNQISHFTDNSAIAAGSIDYHEWHFGDGDTSSTIHPIHTYGTADTFDITLYIRSGEGCLDTSVGEAIVYPSLSNNSIGQDDTICAGSQTSALSGTTPQGGTGSYGYEWQSSTDTISWTTINSSNTVSLAAQTLNTSTWFRRIVRSSPCDSNEANISNRVFILVTQGITNNSIGISDSICALFAPDTLRGALPQGGTGNFSYGWELALDSTSSATGISNASQQDFFPGTLTSTIFYRRIVSSGSCETRSNWVEIRVKPKPNADFTVNNACFDFAHTFSDQSSITTGSIATYSWDFGDTSASSNQSPSHTYGYAGAKTAKLIITSDFGCQDSITKTLFVNPKPVAAFDSSNACLQLANIFTNQSTISSGSLITYSWTFGDGSGASSVSPSHIYGDTGTYAIRLIVSSDSGCTDSVFKTAEVYPKPIAGMITEDVCFNQISHFTDTSSIGAGNIVYHEWHFGDGDTSSTIHPIHTYGAADTFAITLYVRSGEGCLDTSVGEAIVYPSLSNNSIGQDDTICAGSQTSALSGTTPQGGTGSYGYEWQSSTDTISWTTINSSNTVSLAAQTLNTSTWFRRIVRSSPCDSNEANISNRVFILVTQGITNNSIGISDSICALFAPDTLRGALPQGGTGNFSYGWELALDSTSSATGISNASQQDFFPGTLTTTIFYRRIVSSGSCETRSNWVEIRVKPKPRADFSVNNACFDFAHTFSDQSSITTGSIATYSWDFGDTSGSSNQSPSHTYGYAGAKTAKLIITSDFGCQDSITKTLFVNPKPVAAFDSSNACLQLANVFTNQSTISSGSLITYSWTFGDGSGASSVSTSHIYGDTGTYAIRLIVSSDSGCTDSVFKTVEVYPNPIAGMITEDVCFNQISHFTDTSSIGAGNIVYHEWHFGDGDTSSTIHPIHTYGVADTFAITLYVRSGEGCLDTTGGEAIVYPSISNNTITEDDTICAGSSTNAFSGSSPQGGTGSYAYVWQSSTDTVNWSAVSGGNTQNLTAQSPGVSTYYRRLVSSSPCDSNEQSTSNRIYILVTAGIGNNSISSDQIICYGQAPDSLKGSAPSGGTGNFTYQWQSSSDASVWTDINGAVAQQYLSPVLTDTLHFRRIVYSQACDLTSNSVKVAVKPLPEVGFTLTNKCFPEASVFADTSRINQGNLPSRTFYFGDGDSSNSSNPSHVYAAAGSYSVKLIVLSNFGCIDSLSRNYVVYPKPIAQLYQQNNCYPFAMNFRDTSTLSTGNITGWRWRFGDGDSSTVQHPTKSYGADGVYSVDFEVTSDFGCKDTVVQSIRVFPKPSPAWGSTEVCFPNTTNFYDSSSINSGQNQDWQWDFGDGSNASQQNPSHAYAVAGSYTVKLRVVSDSACIDSLSKVIEVRPLPIVSFILDTLGCLNASNPFTNQTQLSQTQVWDFGNGLSDTGFHSQTSYNSIGSYSIRLVSTSPYGCIDSTDRSIRIIAPPVATIDLSLDSGCGPLLVSFSNISINEFPTFQWTMGDGTSYNDTFPSPITYAPSLFSDTTYYVRLIAENKCGIDTALDSVRVLPVPSAVLGQAQSQGCSPLHLQLLNGSYGRPYFYTWNYGDGDTSNQGLGIHTHTFLTGSLDTIYPLSLIARNACGVDTAFGSILVKPNTVTAFFNTDTTRGCEPLNIQFTDYSVGGNYLYYDFGNGNTSLSANPNHVFTGPGIYTIRQFVDNGCAYDTATMQVEVLPNIVPSFQVTKTPECVGTDLSFNNQTAGVGALRWYFGDGDSSDLSTASHAYASAGNYQVTLRVISATNGCPASTSQPVQIMPLPQLALAVPLNQDCPPFSPNFQNTSSNALFYQWDFGDGNTSAGQNPGHTFTQTGSYTVKLIATSAQGCIDSTNLGIIVHPVPIAQYSQSFDTECDTPATLQLNNSSSGATQYQWTFGDGGQSVLNSPSHAYQQFTTFPILLRAENAFACWDTASSSFTVYPVPMADFSFSPDSGCMPLEVQFFNNSQNTTNYTWDFGDGFFSTQQDPIHTYLQAGVYTITLKSVGGGSCADSITKLDAIEVFPKPVAAFTYVQIDNDPIAKGLVRFSNQSQLATQYYWEFGDGDESTALSPEHRYRYHGSYIVQLAVENQYGCQDTTLQEIPLNFFKGLFVPNAFSPEYGLPDVRTFKPAGTSLKTYRLRIFDTYGNLLWESTELANTEPAEGWNGRVEGKLLNQDVYVWKIEAEFLDGTQWPGMKGADGKFRKEGTLSLIR